jgi:C1A family cysteine protease
MHHEQKTPVAPTKATRVYNRKKKTLDVRDHKYHGHLTFGAAAVPPKVDLTPHCGPVFDQGNLGSCTANACAGALEYEENIQNNNDSAVQLSRLFLYYNERALEGDIGQDAGGEIRDVIKVAGQYGAPLEATWPYDDGPTQFTVKPSLEAYAEGLKHKALQYQAVPQTLASFKHVLAVFNRPIVIGITVYESFESDSAMSTGMIPMPNTMLEQCMGGHAVLVVGYDDAKQAFLVRNSWGNVYPPAWPGSAETGSFWLPYEFMMNPELAEDFWVITSIAG